jgi:MarR family transcriptional regulator, negative regulator of the multidrug operon emrRAB
MATTADARLANLLGAVATGLTDAMDDSGLGDGLDSSAQAALVAMLDFSPSGSVRRLSQIIGLTHSGAVRVVNRLADAGWVRRGPGADARSVTVALTPAGRRLSRRVRDHRSEVVTSTMSGLTAQQRDDLTRACEVLVTNVTVQRLARRAAGDAPAGGALCRMCDFEACGRPDGRCPVARTAALEQLRSSTA